MTRFTSFGKDLHSRICTFFDSPLAADASPLEIAQAVLDDVEGKVQAVSRGRRIFPFTAMGVRVCTAERPNPAIVAAFDGFDTRVRERLAEIRCEPPQVLSVQLDCLDETPASWPAGRVFEVTYVAAAPPGVEGGAAESPARTSPVLHVVVLRGTAVEPEWHFSDATVSIGRSADPTDDLGRLRRNRVAFLDVVDGVNETVGRAHARLRSDALTGEVRLFDEGSRNGTAILRRGEVIAVHRRDPRGVRVRSGDEIQIGRALLRIDISG